VVQLEVDYGELVRRISGRRTCADCGRVFNLLTSPPAPATALSPKTGHLHRLVQRPDDNEATVAERLRVYDEKTRPLIDFYRARGLLRVIDAEGDVDAVTRRLSKALGVPELRTAPKKKAAKGKVAAKKTAATGARKAKPAKSRPTRATGKRKAAAPRKERAGARAKRRPVAKRAAGGSRKRR
jgi:adenylate kinase